MYKGVWGLFFLIRTDPCHIAVCCAILFGCLGVRALTSRNGRRYGVDVNLIVFTPPYDEALDMIVEARNYMAFTEPRENRQCDGGRDLNYTTEALRVTSRLLQVIAWLKLVRAMQHGEISLEEVCLNRNRLAGQDVCLATTIDGNFVPPTGLQSLLDRSHELYSRVSRLEQMLLKRWRPDNYDKCSVHP